MSSKSSVKNKPKKYKENTFFPDFVKVTGCVPALIWMRPKVIYMGDKKVCRPKGGVLITANHGTFFDPIKLYCTFWYRRLRFLASKDIYHNKLVTFLFNAAGCIRIDKENFSIGTLHDTVDRLKSGQAIVIFPEGTVNQRGQMMDFKSGAVLLSQLSGAPIQPVFLVRPKKWYHRHVTVVGEPIDIRGMCSRFPSTEELENANQALRQRTQALEDYYTENYSK